MHVSNLYEVLADSLRRSVTSTVHPFTASISRVSGYRRGYARPVTVRSWDESLQPAPLVIVVRVITFQAFGAMSPLIITKIRLSQGSCMRLQR
jgi:hypothetical protein